MHPQVIPEFTSEISWTNDGDLADYKGEWLAMATEFLRGGGGGDGQARKRTWYRKKTYRWLVASDNMLRNTLGKGWQAWSVDTKHVDETSTCTPKETHLRPVVTLTIDQGGDGWAGAHFLQEVLHVNVLLLNDFSHKVWNDVELSLHHSDLWKSCLLGIVMLNADHGPWGNAKWYEEAQSGVQEYLRVASTSCPLFQTHLPNILHECEEPHMWRDEAFVANIFASLPDAVARKFPKVGMSRWFQFFDSMEQYLRVWSQRQLIYQFVCLQLDMWKGGSVRALKLPLAKGVEEELEKTATCDDREAVRKLRKSCANTLQFVTCLLADLFFWALNKGMCLIVQPLRAWYGKGNKRNRSASESLEHFMAMSAGAGVAPLQDMWSVLQSRTLLQQLGLHLDRPPAGVGEITVDHPLVHEENALLAKLYTFTREVVQRRCKSDSWHQVGVPGCFPGFLLDLRGAEFMDRFRDTTKAWREARSQDDRFWKKLCDRSPMRLPLVEDVIAESERNGWKPTERLKQHIQQCFMGITQTKLIEDSFREARRSEVSKNWSKAVRTTRLWHCCAMSTLGDQLHRFKKLPWEDEVIGSAIPRENLQNLFEHLSKIHRQNSRKC